MKKRILSMMIAIVMIVSMIPASALTANAVTTGTTGDCTWSFDDTTGTLTVSGEGAMADYTNGSQPWYAYKDSITTVIIEKGVTSISTNAFREFPALVTVKIAGSVTAIGSNAFYSCTNLSTVEYYGSSNPMADSTAFFGCYCVAKVPSSYSGNVFCGKSAFATLDAANEPVTSTPTPTGVLLKVTKSFNDWDKAESFTFILEPVTAGAPMPASTTAIASEDMPLASFGMITFEAEGTYEYTIIEVDDGIDGITYDKTEHAVVVTVTKGADNSLTAVVTYDGEDSLTITNTYTKPVRITAVDAADGSVLDGVTVQIANARGTIIYEWTTTAEAHEIFGLNIGEEYTVRIVGAPDGYDIPFDTAFSLNDDGNVVSGGSVTEDGVILVVLDKTPPSAAPEVKWGASAGALTNSGTLAEAIAANAAYIQLQKDIASDSALMFRDSVTIDLNGKTLTATDTDYGVFSNSDLTITDSSAAGDGSLTGTTDNYGVRVYGNITVERGSLTGKANNNYGVYADSITVSGGSLTGKADNDYGVWVGSITVEGGSLTGTADGGYGVYTSDGITVKDGSLTGTTTGADGYGVETPGSITVSGGSLTGTGGSIGVEGYEGITVKGGSLTGTGDNYGVWVYGNITVESGSLTGTGDDYGVWGNGSITVSGGSLSGTVTGYYGVYAISTVTVENDGKITATGETATYIGNATGSDYSVESETTDTATGLTTAVLVKKTGSTSLFTDLYATGNGSTGSAWMNGESWHPHAESNKMTEVSDGIYEITYTNVPASDNYAFKIIADGLWELSWGGTYTASGEEFTGIHSADNIVFTVVEDNSTVTIRVDTTETEVEGDPIGITVTVTPPSGGETPAAPTSGDDFTGASCLLFSCNNIEHGTFVADCFFEGYSRAGTVREENGEFFCDITWNVRAYWEAASLSLVEYYGVHTSDTTLPETETFEAKWDPALGKWVYEESETYGISCQNTTPVASVTDKDGNLIGNYETFEEAAEAAKANQNSTIKLLDNAAGCYVKVDSPFTLDLNGYTLDMGDESFDIGSALEGYDCHLTVTDTSGTETGNIIGESYSGLFFVGYSGSPGKLTVLNGTVEYNNEWGGVVKSESKGVAEIKGGTFKNNSGAEIYINNWSENFEGSVDISGGNFPDGFEMKVYSSDYTSTENYLADLLAEGYAFYDKDGARITVADNATEIAGLVQVKSNNVASVTVGGNTTNYTDLEEAFEAAAGASGSTLTLLDNIVRDTAITVESGNFTVDLNGKTWECTDNTAIRLLNDSKLKIDDSSADKTGKLLVSYISTPTICMRDNAELEIAGGTVEHASDVEVVDMSYSGNMTSAKLLVSGGKLITNGNTVINAFGSSVTVPGGVLEHDDSYGARHIYYRTGTVDLSGHPDPSGIVIWNHHVSGDVTLGEDTIKLPAGYVMLDDSGNVQTTLVNGNFYEVGKAPAAVDPVTVIDPENGTVTYTPADAKEGDEVTLVITPDEGYEIDKVTVTDKDGNPVPVDEDNSFVVPSGGATVETTFKKTAYATKAELDEAVKSLEEKIAAQVDPDELAKAVAELEALIDAAKAYADTQDTALKDELEAAIANAIAASEVAMKEWVNGKLEQPLKDIAALQAELSALAGSAATDAELAAAVAAQQAALDGAKADLTAAYEKAIEDATNENNGKISVEIAAAVKTAQDNLQSQIDAIIGEIDKIKARLDITESDINSINQQIDAINTAISNLQNAITGGSTNLSAEIAALNEALTNVKAALEKADADNKAELVKKIEDADKALEEAIKAVQKNLDEAVKDLKAADTANANALTAAIAELNRAIEAAKSAALAGDGELAGKITEAVTKAENDLAAAVKRLEALVGGVQSELKKIETEINDKIADLIKALTGTDSDISKEIKALNEALEEAKKALSKADDDNKQHLESMIRSAESALNTAVAKVQADLEIAKNNLNQAISNGDKDLEDKILALNKALNTAESTLKETDAANKAALEAALASAELTLKNAIDKVQANLDDLQNEIEKRILSLELAMNQNNYALKTQINSLNSALTFAKLQLEQTDAENKAYLESKIAAAEKLIDEAIKSLRSELAQAKTELENAIAAGDSALSADITWLNYTLTSVRSALEAADEANKAELLNEIESAELALKAAIEAVQNNLDSAKAELSDAIAKGDSALGEKIELLSAALAEAKASLEQSDAANKTKLEAAIAKAQTALEAAINEVASDLEEAQKELAAAIADGDTALSDRITALSRALDNAISAYQTADGALRTEMTAKIESADAALDAAIKAVQKNLDDAKAELSKAIADGDTALSDRISALSRALDNAISAYQAADGALKNEMTAMIETADSTLDAAIKAVQKNLDDAKSELGKAIADGDTALDGKVANLNDALAAAKSALEATDATNKSELTTKIDEAYASLDAVIKAVQKNLNDLKAALEAKDNDLVNKDAELENKDAELANKDSELQTFIIIVCVISGAALFGGGAFVVWFFVDRKKIIR